MVKIGPSQISRAEIVIAEIGSTQVSAMQFWQGGRMQSSPCIPAIRSSLLQKLQVLLVCHSVHYLLSSDQRVLSLAVYARMLDTAWSKFARFGVPRPVV